MLSSLFIPIILLWPRSHPFFLSIRRYGCVLGVMASHSCVLTMHPGWLLDVCCQFEVYGFFLHGIRRLCRVLSIVGRCLSLVSRIHFLSPFFHVYGRNPAKLVFSVNWSSHGCQRKITCEIIYFSLSSKLV